MPSNLSSISRLVRDVAGQSKLALWSGESQEWLWVCLLPSDSCSIPSVCGGFGCCNRQAVPSVVCLHGFEPGKGGREFG